MKTLYESLLDDFNVISKAAGSIDNVKQFLKDNYKCKGNFSISKRPNKDGYYEVSADDAVTLTNLAAQSLTNNMFIFTEVKGYFVCRGALNIESLEGAPAKTGADFDCSKCSSLVSLEGAPERVMGTFRCNNCKGKFEPNDVKKYCKSCWMVECD